MIRLTVVWSGGSKAAACFTLAGALLLQLVWAQSAEGQAAQVTTDVGPHYVGEAVSIRVTAVGFEEDPPPVAEAPEPAEGRLELVGVSPSVSQAITIVNGKMSRTREVTHVFQFRFVANAAGPVRLGPFRIVQGSREAKVGGVALAIQGVPSNDDVRVALKLPSEDVFVGERVSVTVSFTLEQSLQKNALGYVLHVPLFDEQSTFRFLDEEQQPGDTNVLIDTGSRKFELRGSSRTFSEGKKRFTEVRVTRTMVPLVAGRHQLPRIAFSVEEGVRFRRDFFGGRRATQVRRWRAEDPGVSLDVAAIPGREQPPSFGGAIGRGFSLEVSADRTVVQVGDPITLTFRLHGQGLETASLPPLDAEGLLPGNLFRVPSDVPTGELGGDVKRFTAVVRVLDETVQEIPALSYSWFDPDSKQFETTRSRPIALSVRSAEVIGARDVQVGDESAAEASGEEAAVQNRRVVESTRPRSFGLTGADLAIETSAAAVLGSRAAWGGSWLTPSVYGCSLVLVGVAYFDRRRRQQDPAIARRRKLLDDEIARLAAAGSLEPVEGAREIGEAIRRMLREVPDATSADLDELLGECDARSYAPPGTGAPALSAHAEFVAQALALARTISPTAANSGRTR